MIGAMTSTTPSVRKLGPHPVVLRELSVVRTALVTPRMMRVTLGGEQLDRFESPAPDDHVVLFFLREDQQVPVSEDPKRRPIWDERPPTRDYTPRRFDAAAGELDVDFVLHGEGVASPWAESAVPGTRIAIGGPRGSVVAEGFDHYLLLGDESSLPAIARRVEELPASASAQVFVEVRDGDDEQDLSSAATVEVRWLHRGEREPGTTDLLLEAVRSSTLPDAPLYASVAGETDVVRGLRHHLLGERGLTPAHTRFSGYWKRSV
jgi:NADPH-dependent ferric siderophore reductase